MFVYRELWNRKAFSEIINVYVIVTHVCIVSCKIGKLKRNHKCLCNCYTCLYCELWNIETLKRYHKCLCNCFTQICIMSCKIEQLKRYHKCLCNCHTYLWVVKSKSWSEIMNVYVIVTHICIVCCEIKKLKRNHKCLCNCHTDLYCELWNRKAEAKS
jgi:hypothetical protein